MMRVIKQGQNVDENLGRVLRLLSSGDRLLRQRPQGGWAVFAHGDLRRRPMIEVSDEVLTLLHEGGHLIASEDVPQAYAVADAAQLREPVKGMMDAPVIPPARAEVQGTGFMRLAQLARRGEGPLDKHMVLAAQRYCALQERTMRGPRLVQSWDTVGGAQRAGSGSAVEAAYIHQMQDKDELRRVHAALDEIQREIVQAALLNGQSLNRLERRFGWRKGEAGDQLAAVLRILADALDAGPSLR